MKTSYFSSFVVDRIQSYAHKQVHTYSCIKTTTLSGLNILKAANRLRAHITSTYNIHTYIDAL